MLSFYELLSEDINHMELKAEQDEASSWEQ